MIELNDRGARSLQITLVACALVAFAASGCASMRREKVVPESIAACRQLSRDGLSAMEMGKLGQAQDLLQEAVAISPTDLDARRHLAEVLWQTGNRRDAVVHMEAAVKLDPRHAPTVVRAGEMLLALGAVDRAHERARQAVSLDPALAGAWALRGRVHQQKGDALRALADLQQALRYSPHAPDVLLATAELQYSMGHPERSLTTLHHLLDVYAPGEEPQKALWLEGLAYQAMGRPRDAVESLHAATLRSAPPADLLYQLAVAQQSAGQPAAATIAVQQALAIDTTHQPSRALLAELQSVAAANGDVILR